MRTIGLVLLALFLCGCETDFGDRAKEFAEHHAREYSIRHAKADLANRWQNSFRVGFLDQGVRIERLNSAIEELKIPAAPNSQAKPVELFETAAALGQLLRHSLVLQAAVEDLRASQDAVAAGVCDDRSVFRATGLEQLPLAAPFQDLPKQDPNWNAQWTGNWVTSLVVTVSGWIGASGTEQQVARAREAEQIFRERVVKGDELFEISRNACRQEWDRFAALRSPLVEAATSLAEAVAAKHENIGLLRRLVEAHLIPLNIEAVATETGLAVRIEAINKDEVAGQLAIDTSLVTAHLSTLRKQAANAGDCPAGLRSLEAYSDGLAEADSEVKLLGVSPWPAAVRAQLSGLAGNVTTAREEAGELREAIKGKPCR